MAAITDYASLAAALSDWAERDDYDAAQVIGLAEAEFRLALGPSYARQSSTTLTFASGSVALPSGFIRPIALTHATYGAIFLSTIAAVRVRRTWDTSGVPDIYAITGGTLEAAPTFSGDATFDFESTLTGLSASNTTNWLITAAPQAYLSMCLHFIKAHDESADAGSYKASSLQTLMDLGILSAMSQMGKVALPGMTP